MKYLQSLSIVLAVAIMMTGCKPPQSAEEAAANETPEEAQVIPVRINMLAQSEISRTIDYTATLEAYEEVHLAPATPGRIDNIYVEIGDVVKKGKKLFRMDQTQLSQAKVQLESLETDLGRISELLKSGSSTQQQYDQLKTQYDVTASNVKFLSENTLIYAPFDGVITGKYFENGEMFGGAPNTPAGKAAVVTLMQVDRVKAMVNISENYLPLMKKGIDVSVKADVYPDRDFNGKVSLVHPTINPISRSFSVEVTLNNNDGALRPGMFVRVAMNLGQDMAYVVPANIVLQQEGTNIRYLFVENNGQVKRENITIGKRFDDKIEVISDRLKDGDRLVVEGQTKLTDGDAVKVVK